MSVLDSIKLVIYRVHEKGLEVFLLNEENEQWEMPEGWLDEQIDQDKMIELDPIEEDGKVKRAVAIEGDWHDIPSIRKLIQKDVSKFKDKLKSYLPSQAKGSFVAVKEAVGKVVPNDNRFLNELKEIISEKNLTKYI
jgi:hypothetical protein